MVERPFLKPNWESERTLISWYRNRCLHACVQPLQSHIAVLQSHIAALQSDIALAPTEFIMPNFEIHRQRAESWNSIPIYTHPQGYKMRLMVKANGSIVRVKTHMSQCLSYSCLESSMTTSNGHSGVALLSNFWTKKERINIIQYVLTLPMKHLIEYQTGQLPGHTFTVTGWLVVKALLQKMMDGVSDNFSLIRNSLHCISKMTVFDSE